MSSTATAGSGDAPPSAEGNPSCAAAAGTAVGGNINRFDGLRRRASNISANVRQKAADSGVAARAANLSANVRQKAVDSGVAARAANLSANVRERAVVTSAVAVRAANIRLARSTDSDDPPAEVSLSPTEIRLEELRRLVRRMDVLVERVRKNTERSLNRMAEQAAREEQREREQEERNNPPSPGGGNAGEGAGQRKRLGWPRTPARKGRAQDNRSLDDAAVASAAFFSALIVPVGPRDTAELAENVRCLIEIILEDERVDEMRRFEGDDGDVNACTDEGPVPTELKRKPTMSAFDLFTEMNVLSLVSSILTGEAFRPQNEGSERFGKAILLPPPSVARELLQSLSRLLRDTSHDSTLFMILSNKEFRGLIDLPLELYGVAKTLSRGRLQDSPLGRRMNTSTNSRSGTISGMTSSVGSTGGNSAMIVEEESSVKDELLGSFVGFLKGMSFRMRPETTQFFLVYPDGDREMESESESGSVATEDVVGEEPNSSSPPPSPPRIKHYGVSIRNFTDNYDEDYDSPMLQEERPAIDDGPDAAAGGLPTPAAAAPELEEKARELKIRNIEFPLYARTLQLLSLDHSDLVRLSAVSICLDIIQLVTSDDSDLWHGAGEASRRERMEVARYLCSPARVHCLVASNVTRLVNLCDALEEEVREADALVRRLAAERARDKITLGSVEAPRPMLMLSSTTNVAELGAISMDGAASPKASRRNSMNVPTLEEEGQMLRERLKKTLTNVEVELQLLGGILQAGLTSLNEQVVENVLSTYVRRLIRPLATLSLGVESHPNLPLLLSNLRREGTRGEGEDRKGAVGEADSFVDRVGDALVPPTEDINGDAQPSGGDDSALAFDSAPAKASLICLAALFYNVPDSPPLINLSFAATFHPHGVPERPEEHAIESTVEVFEKRGMGGAKDATKLRTDRNAAPVCYDFGRGADGMDASSAKKAGVPVVDDKERVAFAWSRALACALEGSALSPSPLAPNRTREAVAACLAHSGQSSGEGGTTSAADAALGLGRSALRPFALVLVEASLGVVSADIADAIVLGKDCICRRRESVDGGGSAFPPALVARASSSSLEAGANEGNSVFSGASTTAIMTETEDDSSSACSSLTRASRESDGKASLSSAKVKELSSKLKKKGRKGLEKGRKGLEKGKMSLEKRKIKGLEKGQMGMSFLKAKAMKGGISSTAEF